MPRGERKLCGYKGGRREIKNRAGLRISTEGILHIPYGAWKMRFRYMRNLLPAIFGGDDDIR